MLVGKFAMNKPAETAETEEETESTIQFALDNEEAKPKTKVGYGNVYEKYKSK